MNRHRFHRGIPQRLVKFFQRAAASTKTCNKPGHAFSLGYARQLLFIDAVKLLLHSLVTGSQPVVALAVCVLVLSRMCVFIHAFPHELCDHGAFLGEGSRFFLQFGGICQGIDDILVVVNQPCPVSIKPVEGL